MGRRRAENWKSLFGGVWRAENRREVALDKELSQTLPCRMLAFRSPVDRQGRKESERALSLPGIKENCYCKYNNKASSHLMSTC